MYRHSPNCAEKHICTKENSKKFCESCGKRLIPDMRTPLLQENENNNIEDEVMKNRLSQKLSRVMEFYNHKSSGTKKRKHKLKPIQQRTVPSKELTSYVNDEVLFEIHKLDSKNSLFSDRSIQDLRAYRGGPERGGTLTRSRISIDSALIKAYDPKESEVFTLESKNSVVAERSLDSLITYRDHVIASNKMKSDRRRTVDDVDPYQTISRIDTAVIFPSKGSSAMPLPHYKYVPKSSGCYLGEHPTILGKDLLTALANYTISCFLFF